ncbi:MAG: IMPACT family protein [Luteibaculaceae bacterium]
MTDAFSYLTVSKISTAEIREKGSKFLGFLQPMEQESQLKQVLQNFKQEHPDAVHYCFAYKLGLKGESIRSSDDGEPSGSAGLPILNQLTAANLTFCLLTVVRYYGGIKLGVSGLVKAYKETAKLTIDSADIIAVEMEDRFTIKFNYSETSAVNQIIAQYGGKITQQHFTHACMLQVSILSKLTPEFSARLSALEYLGITFMLEG